MHPDKRSPSFVIQLQAQASQLWLRRCGGRPRLRRCRLPDRRQIPGLSEPYCPGPEDRSAAAPPDPAALWSKRDVWQGLLVSSRQRRGAGPSQSSSSPPSP